MATNFPTSLDSLTNPTSTDGLDNPSHSAQHADANDAIEALEAKVGVNSSAVATSLDYLVTQANAPGDSGLISGTYYTAPSSSNATSNSAPSTNVCSFMPFLVEQTQSFDRIAIQTTSSFTGTATYRLGIYNNGDRQPTTVLLDAGTVLASATSTIYAITISQSLSAGWYWLAAVCQATTGNSQIKGITNLSPFRQGTMSATFTYTSNAWQQSGVSGAFSTASGIIATNATLLVALRTV
jgi:hypothetical protein